MTLHQDNITAVILAGGQGRRMGGQDKGLMNFNGKPLVSILIDLLQQQSVAIVINANRNLPIYQEYGYPVISDKLQNYQGPLAGFASAMAALTSEFILTLPCDSPLLASDYVARFVDCGRRHEAPILVAHDGDRLQPVHALIKVSLLASLNQFLESGERKIDRWYAQHNYQTVDFSDTPQMFRNINTPADQQSLEAET